MYKLFIHYQLMQISNFIESAKIVYLFVFQSYNHHKSCYLLKFIKCLLYNTFNNYKNNMYIFILLGDCRIIGFGKKKCWQFCPDSS